MNARVNAVFAYINLYSPTSGSKQKIQTYKYGEKQQKAKEKTVSKCRLHVTMLHAIIQYSTHHYSTNTNFKRIRCNFTETIFGTGELKIE